MILLFVAIMNNAMLITAFYYYHDDFPSTSQFHDIMKLSIRKGDARNSTVM